jgi:hypothetical protein
LISSAIFFYLSFTKDADSKLTKEPISCSFINIMKKNINSYNIFSIKIVANNLERSVSVLFGKGDVTFGKQVQRSVGLPLHR